jgi:hypothetical protein
MDRSRHLYWKDVKTFTGSPPPEEVILRQLNTYKEFYGGIPYDDFKKYLNGLSHCDESRAVALHKAFALVPPDGGGVQLLVGGGGVGYNNRF